MSALSSKRKVDENIKLYGLHYMFMVISPVITTYIAEMCFDEDVSSVVAICVAWLTIVSSIPSKLLE
jgi:hypothetical protein